MPQYIAERYLPGITTQQLMAAAVRARDTTARMTDEGTRISYQGSTFVPGDESCFCLFEGPSTEVVEEANRRAAIPFERVIEAVRVLPEELG